MVFLFVRGAYAEKKSRFIMNAWKGSHSSYKFEKYSEFDPMLLPEAFKVNVGIKLKWNILRCKVHKHCSY